MKSAGNPRDDRPAATRLLRESRLSQQPESTEDHHEESRSNPCLRGDASAYGRLGGEWQPTRPVEFVVAAGAGGGSDIFARTVQSIIVKYNLMPQSIVVLNKGAAPALRGSCTSSRRPAIRTRSCLGPTTSGMLPLVAKVAWKFDELNPIAAMAFDEFLLWTRPNAPWKTAAEYVAEAKKRPGEIKMGGSQSKDTDQLLVRIFREGRGYQADLCSLQVRGRGGGAARRRAHRLETQQSGRERRPMEGWAGDAAVCLQQDRLAAGPKVTSTMGWADIPLCKEQGIPVEEYKMPRDTFLPPGVPEAAVAYYAQVMRR